jgi:hypothetical protein
MPFVAIRSQRCLFSLRVACAAYLASLLPACAACAACGLALFSNGVFRVCVRITRAGENLRPISVPRISGLGIFPLPILREHHYLTYLQA